MPSDIHRDRTRCGRDVSTPRLASRYLPYPPGVITRLALVVTVALVAAGCGGEGRIHANPVTISPVTTGPITTSPATASPVTTSVVTTSPAITSPVTTSAVTTSPVSPGPVTTSPVLDVPPQLAGIDIGEVRLSGVELRVAIADTAARRSQGLMNVTDLGSLDGMVFVWEDDTVSNFWMKDTPMPLDIAWFDSSGLLVSTQTMQPCPAGETCVYYSAAGPYRVALEMPAGTMPPLTDNSTLEPVAGF